MVTDSNVLPDNLGFNSESFYKYFVVGNLFGLIDNFGKNTTYRSWLNGNYYIDPVAAYLFFKIGVTFL